MGSHQHEFVRRACSIATSQPTACRFDRDGFLGSGKTTPPTICSGIPGMAETAVIINEFGEIGLDHLLVERADGDMAAMASGRRAAPSATTWKRPCAACWRGWMPARSRRSAVS